MSAIKIESDECWHALRAQHVGASECAALFNLSPYYTRFMLHHAKAGRVALPPADDARVDWGTLLQPAIAAGVAAEMRWRLEEKSLYYVADDVPGMGATLDYEIVEHEAGPGAVEIKNVDWLQWKQNWTETTAPAHIELQLQHQLAVTGFPWGAIAVLVGGNDLRIYERAPHPPTIERLRVEVAAFWALIAAGIQPDPFGAAVELVTLRELCRPDPKEMRDLSNDYDAFEAAREYAYARDQERFFGKLKDATMAKLLHCCGTAQVVTLPGFDIRRDKRGRFYRCEMQPDARPPDPGVPRAFL